MTLVTAEELIMMPRGSVRRELVRGVIRELPWRGEMEGLALTHLLMHLHRFAKGSGAGMVYPGVGCQLASDPDTVLAPAIAFVAADRKFPDDDGYVPGAPDLAVEAVSFMRTSPTAFEKALEWLEAGTRLAIVIDPFQRTATVYRSPDDVTLLTEGDVLDGGAWCRGGCCRCATSSPDAIGEGERAARARFRPGRRCFGGCRTGVRTAEIGADAAVQGLPGSLSPAILTGFRSRGRAPAFHRTRRRCA